MPQVEKVGILLVVLPLLFRFDQVLMHSYPYGLTITVMRPWRSLLSRAAPLKPVLHSSDRL